MKQKFPAQWGAAGDRVCRAEDDVSCIRELRLARRIQNRELAASMGVTPARISVLERDERRGAVTLKMMQKAAAALGCEFVYTLIPKHRPPPEHMQTQPRPKPRIQLDSTQLCGDTEQQRRMLEQEYARNLTRSTQD